MESFIRNRDVFAIDVKLAYKGQKSFNTHLGGCCTILLYMAILVSFPMLLNDQISNPRWNVNQFVFYKSVQDLQPTVLDT